MNTKTPFPALAKSRRLVASAGALAVFGIVLLGARPVLVFAVDLPPLPLPSLTPAPLPLPTPDLRGIVTQPVPAGPTAVPYQSGTTPPPAAAGGSGVVNPSGAAPVPSADSPAPAAAAATVAPGGTPGPAETESVPTLRIPFTQFVIVGSPLNLALLTAIAATPLLVALWFLLFGRTLLEARRRRDSGLRQALAGELGVAAGELKSMPFGALSKLREQVAFDDLTGTLRRAAGIAAADREIARAQRLKETLSVAFLDVDGLKRVNDDRGHAAGDAILKGVASLLQERLRGQDLVFRFGGDEFVCVMPETGLAVAQETLMELQLEAREKGLAFSFGAADLEPGDDTVSLLGRADGHLYQAKQETTGAQPLPLRPRRPIVLS